MRFHVSIICLILVGFLSHEGSAQQFDSLTMLDDFVPSISDLDIEPQSSSANITKNAPAGFGNAFENALSQFPQNRMAKRGTNTQDPGPITVSQGSTARTNALDSNATQRSLPNSVNNNRLPNQPNHFPAIPANQQVGQLHQLPPEASYPGNSNSFSQTMDRPFQGQNATESFQWQAPVTMATEHTGMPQQGFSQMGGPVPMMGGYVDDPMTWWKAAVMQPLDGARGTESVDANLLVYRALQGSPRIQAVSQDPLIRELQIVEADADFDPVNFLRSQFEDRVDPVGNQLTVGNGESFLKDNIWSADVGFRKRARTGATWELNQRLGFQNSNSTFFDPQDQGTATLALNVTQPLLRGRGRYFNESQILIAQATNGAAWQTFHAELQDELLGVVSAYWDLYLRRSIFLQRQRNVERGQKILTRLEGRAELDSLPSQIARARSSVQTRRTELANALRDVKNAETEVRRRIADNSWMAGGGSELIPAELPSQLTFQLPLEQVVYSALQHRPEVNEAMTRARIAVIQRDVSANELLPELSLLLGTYVSSLRGDTGILNAFQDQFGQVKPGYSVGVNFELPYGNRAARSRFAQRQLQAKKIRAEVDEVMQSVIAESQVALRRVESASETLLAAIETIKAAHADRNQFEQRWESFALVEGDLADGQNPTSVLDQLLDSQDRLASAELVYVQAERELKVSEVALQRAMGTLLMTQNIEAGRSYEGDTPRLDLYKDGTHLPSIATGIPTTVEPHHIDATPAGFNGFAQ